MHHTTHLPALQHAAVPWCLWSGSSSSALGCAFCESVSVKDCSSLCSLTRVPKATGVACSLMICASSSLYHLTIYRLHDSRVWRGSIKELDHVPRFLSKLFHRPQNSNGARHLHSSFPNIYWIPRERWLHEAGTRGFRSGMDGAVRHVASSSRLLVGSRCARMTA